VPSGACVIEYRGTRGVVWRIKYADAEGRQVMETIGAERDGVTRKQAEAELRERLVRVERKGYRRPKALTFGEWADTWFAEGPTRRAWKPATVKAYRNALDAHLKPAFGTTRLEGVRPRDVAAFVRVAMSEPHERFNRPLSPRYVNVLLNVMYDLYKSAVAEELVQANPVVGIERPKTRRRRWRILQPQEVGRVANAFTDDRARRLFLTLMLTGLRRFELQGLRWRDVNLLEATLRVVESKSEEGERLVALPPTLAGELAAHYQQSAYRSDIDYVFGHPTRGSRLEHEWYAGEFRKALAAAGITDYVGPFHDARHAALTNMAATGASPIAVMATAGHRSMQTTKQYLHLAGVVFRDESAALEQRLLGTESVEGAGRNQPETASSSGTA
jgi:integrase